MRFSFCSKKLIDSRIKYVLAHMNIPAHMFSTRATYKTKLLKICAC